MSYLDNIRKVIPYTPGEQPNRPGMIKLNTNENPYPPAPGVEKVLKEFNEDTLRLYPDPKISSLVNALAKRYSVDPEQVFVGVGSDDVLAMCFMTFFNSEKPILFPDITYSFYDVWAKLLRVPFETVALDENLCINAKDYMRENGGIIFPNPNAPTGVLLPLSEIESIIKANPDSIVIVDEAYIDFGGVSALPLVEKYDNVVVVQTFSKSRSMAGMRLGYAIGSKELIKYLNDVKYSFNSYTIDRVSMAAGVASVEDEAHFQSGIKKIISTRERTKVRLKELGFSMPDSMSNFVFATHESAPAKEIFDKLRQSDIFVRYFNLPKIDNYLRITIGTDEEMDRLFEKLGEILCR
ncbi:MAG: histidinol-phosphate transaminase [Lachnospiraceae bacterium]|nr:histidinol-phosphate transaminase [Lachnospiraceae bacterium]